VIFLSEYNITGMNCAACAAKVEKAVLSVKGVTSCQVNILLNTLTVSGSFSQKDIVNAVKNAGYGIVSQKNFVSEDTFKDTQTPILKKRFFTSLIFMLILMYFSMGHTMLSLPLPSLFTENPILIALIQFSLSLIIIILNRAFFVNGAKSFKNKAPNMDTLVSLGSGASFIYSVAIMILSFYNLDQENKLLHNLYFESSAMILVLITLGKILEAKAKGKTTNALKGLIDLTPKSAIIIKDDKEITINASEIQKGDIFVVKPGLSFPCDGIIVEGFCSVDQSALTGESVPVDKTIGDKVSASTINTSGYVICKASNVGEETTLAQIIKLVKQASSSKAPIAKTADKISGIFVPFVLIVSLFVFIVWLILNAPLSFALSRAISVLVISCPCALGLATPVAIMVGSGVGAKNGILFKTATSLEQVGKTNIVALDKTGTITKGVPVVTDIYPFETQEEEFILFACAIESKSEHILAKAITNAFKKSFAETEVFEEIPGNGLKAIFNEKELISGSLNFISQNAEIDNSLILKGEEFSEEGKTCVYFAYDKKCIGIIALRDEVKEDSKDAISQLKKMGIETVMITGDKSEVALSVKEKTGIDQIISQVLPQDKEKEIKKLSERGYVAMVGDGINDSPALTSAHTGIAIGAGTDIAIDSADIVLIRNSLTDIPKAITLSRNVLKNIYENLFWAFIYNIVGIPLAAGAFIPIFGITLSPMFGALAMSLSSFCVVTNALRLNLVNLNKPVKLKYRKEKKHMEVVLKIEGMMCPHCEANVKACLEKIDGVNEAIPNHKEGIATIKLSKDINVDLLKRAITDAGYTVIQ
jgi:Cu2+-exporting ATPase